MGQSAARLSEAERLELFRRLRADNDQSAREQLVASYLDLARYFSGRYHNRPARDEDLDQVAAMALVKAIDRFDPERGVKFSTFAGRTIDGELKRWSVMGPYEFPVAPRKAFCGYAPPSTT